MFKLFKLIAMLYSFVKESKRVMGETETAIAGQGGEQAIALRQSYRRILWLAGGLFFFGLIVLPCATPWIYAAVSGAKPYDKVYDATWRMALGATFCFFPAFVHLFAGVALGCLVAPPDFLESPAGKAWQEVIGVKNATASRVVCSVAVLASVAVMVGSVWLITVMAPFKPEPKFQAPGDAFQQALENMRKTSQQR